MIKPHTWVGRGGYTGDFELKNESDWKKFEQQYSKYVLEFAKVADSTHAEIYCIATEFKKFVEKRPDFWKNLIVEVRKVYKGKLTYAANWDDYDKFPFWNKLDFIGIDAYFPLTKAITPALIGLQAAWTPHIAKMEALNKQVGKPIIFTEYGYRNTDSCTVEPWKENITVINNQAQANAYEALYQTIAKKPWFAGGFVWKWYADDYYRNAISPDYTPQLKPAEVVIAKWYGSH